LFLVFLKLLCKLYFVNVTWKYYFVKVTFLKFLGKINLLKLLFWSYFDEVTFLKLLWYSYFDDWGDNSARGLIYCRLLIKCIGWVHFSTKLLWNPPLLQGGAPKTNLGKVTTPHTPPSEPLLMWNPPVDAQRSAWHTHYTHNAERSRMSTIVSKQFDWHFTHFSSSQGWAVTQINKPSMFRSSTHHNIYDKVTLLKLRQILIRGFCLYAYFSLTKFLRNTLM